MKVNKKIRLLGMFVLFAITLSAQEAYERKGTKEYENYSYIDAIKIYEKVADKGYESNELLQNLGNSYYFNGKLKEANKWYNRLFKKETSHSIPSEYFYRYAQTLKAIDDYKSADLYLKRFSDLEKADSRVRLFASLDNYLEAIKDHSGRYKLEVATVNSPLSDYGSTVYNDQMIFTSSREKGGVSKTIHTWTNQEFTRLYAADINKDGQLGKPAYFAPEIGSKFNESTPVFSADGKTMYFTRNNYNSGTRLRDAKGITLLKIYQATWKNNRWSDVVELPFNSNQFSTAHPALTPDGKWMYFASDREGSIGQSDLYKVAINNDGTFGQPINLGAHINTEGRESFPFITADNELYFSTDGRPGLGGLDIFATQINDDQSFTEVKNIGEPANSPYDDFAYYINTLSRKGFLSSNRSGDDEIYGFTESKRLPLGCLQAIEGAVFDLPTGGKLANAKVTLFDNEFKKLKEVLTDENGAYEFKDLACNFRYRINAELADYNTAELAIVVPRESGKTRGDFGLEKNKVVIKKGDDLFKVLKLEPIYFDFDKDDIRVDAQVELAKIVEVLREYPKMKIDVRSHTDSRGNDNYNLKLSDRRAKSTAKWIINQGVKENRVMGRGFGETQLINSCSNGINCSEEEHQQNRRSEFIILEM